MTASPNVLINNLRALRVGDSGVHTSPQAGTRWIATQGASRVLINDRLLHRRHDAAEHGHQDGLTLEGSPDVLVGDYMGPSSPRHETVKLRLLDIPGPHGMPLRNTRWRLLLGHLAVEKGVTDDQGNVHLRSTLAPETAYWLRYRGRQICLYVSAGSAPGSAKGIKARLAFLGYNPGHINNTFDSRAVAALRQFQIDARLDPDGVADETTIGALVRAAGF